MSGKTIPVKGLCFDKDGTLFDFAATWEAWAKAFLRRAAKGDETRAASIGTAIGFDLSAGKFARDSLVIAGTPGEVTQALAPHFSDLSPEGILDMINEEAARAPQQPAVPLRPLLEAFRASVGVTDLFDFIAGYDSGFGGKPAPGQLLGFARAVNLPPEQIVMVGDSTHDLDAGRAAGMRTIGVLTGAASAQDLAPHANIVLRDIGEIPAWLTEQAAQ